MTIQAKVIGQTSFFSFFYLLYECMTIRLLPDHLINQLKAGEIVERPASIVKELVENALDANAQHITIYLDAGGKDRIRIIDDGDGIHESDLSLVLEKFATSKINHYDDLRNLTSFGFRGEALASIADVCHISILTKHRDDDHGSHITKIDHTASIVPHSVAFDHGTDTTVTDLFRTTPARLPFLKSDNTEYSLCYNLIKKMSLAHPHCAFTLRHNNVMKREIPSHTSLTERIRRMYPSHGGTMLSFDETFGLYTRKGSVSHPSLHLSSPKEITLIVNQRVVDDHIVKRAILDAYKHHLPAKHYPLAVLSLTMPPSDVDCNVHPRKTQVSFVHPSEIYRQVHTIIATIIATHKVGITTHQSGQYQPQQSSGPQQKKSGLTQSSSPSPTGRSGSQPARSYPNDSISSSPIQGNLFGGADESSSDQIVPQSFDKRDTHQEDHQNTFHNHQQAPLLSADNLSIIGQARNTYIIAMDNQSLYYIDHHALAERIAYEKMLKNLEHNANNPDNRDTMMLLTPIPLDIPHHPLIDQKLETLDQRGFDLSHISDRKVLLHGVPAIFVQYPRDMQTVLTQLIVSSHMTIRDIVDRVLATKACKISIKAGEKLSHEQMHSLLAQGFAHIPGGFVCQHGRPFFIQIPKPSIDGMFDR